MQNAKWNIHSAILLRSHYGFMKYRQKLVVFIQNFINHFLVCSAVISLNNPEMWLKIPGPLKIFSCSVLHFAFCILHLI